MKFNTDRLRYSAQFITNRLLIILFFAILTIYCSREIADLDLWLHLKTGEVILRTGKVPLHDIFSFTIPGRPWVNHEWLFQMIAYKIYSFGGPDGLIVMQNFVFMGVFLCLFFFGRKQKNHPVLIFTVLYLTLLAVAYRFTVRPDIFSLLFMSLYLFLLKDPERNAGWKTAFLFVALQLIWVNMHGFSFLGPVLVGIVVIAGSIKKAIPLPAGLKKRTLGPKAIKIYLATFFLMLIASAANPGGLEGALYPLKVLGQISTEGRVVFQYIQELARPIAWSNILDFNNFLYFKVLILLSLFSFRVNRRDLELTELILWAFFLAFSLLAIRNVAYFSIVAAFIILSNFGRAVQNGKTFPRIWPRKADTAVLYCFIAFMFIYPSKGALKYLEATSYSFDDYQLKSELWGVARDRYPQKGVAFLLSHNFPGHMFNDFNSGSYLIGNGYPLRRVFIDGRTELYGPKFFKLYVDIGDGKKEALDTLFAKYDIKGFFLSNPYQDLHLGLIRYLFQDKKWKIVYFDENTIIFVLDSPENQALIKNFNIDLKRWRSAAPDLLKVGIAQRFPAPFLRKAHLLNALHCYEAAWGEAKAALEIMPNNAEAFLYAHNYFYDKGDYLQAYKYARLNLIYGGPNSWMRCRLALTYHNLGEDDKANKVIDSIIKNNPKFGQAYYTKAMIIKDSDPKAAIENLKKAVDLAKKEPRFARELGDILNKTGDKQGALKYWKAAYEYDSANPELRAKIFGG